MDPPWQRRIVVPRHRVESYPFEIYGQNMFDPVCREPTTLRFVSTTVWARLRGQSLFELLLNDFLPQPLPRRYRRRRRRCVLIDYFYVFVICLQDRPGIVTGWWQQSTIDKFRLLTLEGLSSVVKFKKEQLAAATAEVKGKPSNRMCLMRHPVPSLTGRVLYCCRYFVTCVTI